MWEGWGVLSGVLVGRACQGVRVWGGRCDLWGRDSGGSCVGSRGDAQESAEEVCAGTEGRRGLEGGLATKASPTSPPTTAGNTDEAAPSICGSLPLPGWVRSIVRSS